ncbi:hypothetical protein B0H19DRAFT_1081924 [Mycena capillaripes]|nr:hypothetical protein B0H19DRAFT_1081924 [Mycena capillaripes]
MSPKHDKGKQRETFDVEAEDERFQRIHQTLQWNQRTLPSLITIAERVLENLNTVKSVAGLDKEDILDDLERVRAFLPQIQAANAESLEKASIDPGSVDMKNVEADEKFIQMSLGLGVFEDRTRKEGSDSLSGESSYEDDSEEDSDETSTSSGISESTGDESDDDQPLPFWPIKALPRRAGRPQIVLSETTTSSKGD